MTGKQAQLKRKQQAKVILQPSKSQSETKEDDEGFFNTIHSEDGDSSDTERELQDSDEEDNSEEEAESNEYNEKNVNEGDSDSESEGDQNSEQNVDEAESGSSSGHEQNIDEESKESESESEDESTKESTAPNNTNKTKFAVKKAIKSASKANDEYQDDSSDEEDIRNTVGNVPMKWYEDFKHLGYDWDGQPIGKPIAGDSIDEFLKRVEDPDFWRTVKDPQTGQDVVLSEEDVALIRRIQAQKIPDASFDAYAPWIEWFTSEVEQMPLRKFPDHKRSFLPSKDEARKVSKLVHALKMGWIKTESELAALRARKDPQFYMLWTTDDTPEDPHLRGIHRHIAAPKRHLPGHAESYNPPEEYLFDDKEMKQWERQKNAPWQRKLHFVPKKYDSIRNIPSYGRFIKERFLRCLDLYLCPRAIKMRVTVEPDDLVPKLPSPRDLQPFPATLSLEYIGHEDMVRTISVDRTGQYLASGSDDGTVRIWEVNTGRCFKKFPTGDVVRSVQWCPNSAISLLLVASGQRVILLNPHVGDLLVNTKTDDILATAPAIAPEDDTITSERIKAIVTWSTVDPDSDEYALGFRIILSHFKQVAQVTWHGRGDYFATVMPEGQNRSVLISQLSRRRSQLPFTKSKGLVQCVLFHPIRPVLFVATQRHVRVYDLVQQALVKKLMSNSRWISRMAVHPAGDNLLVATYDRKVLWFDLDLSSNPYKTLRLHGTAVRGIAFHKRYPLFASGSDCRSLIVSHGMVYNDLLQNPLIVPLKRLQDHKAKNDFGIFDVEFHPFQPWLFSSGADGTIKLYSN